MKLHLPKQLFTALLAVLTFAAPAAWGGVTSTSKTNSEGVSYTEYTYTGDGNQKIDTSSYEAKDVVIFQMGTGSGNYFGTTESGTYTCAANVQILDNAETTAVVEGLNLTDGHYKSTWEISGKVTGNGAINKNGAGAILTLVFSGNVTEYTGNINLASTVDSYTLIFGGKDSAVAASEPGSTKGIAGTGNITFTTDKNTLTFNYAAASAPVYVKNSIVAGGSGTSRVKVVGGADMVFTSAVTIHELITDATSGSITFQGVTNLGKDGTTNDLMADITVGGSTTMSGIITNNGTLTVNSGATLTSSSAFTNAAGASVTISGALTSTGAFTNNGTLTVESGATLTAECDFTSTNGTVSVAENATLTLGNGTNASTHSIGTLSAASGTVTLAENATLTLGDETNASTHSIGTVVASSAGNTIHLNDKATLAGITKGTGSGSITLTGSGTYNLGASKTMTTGVSLADTWEGSVKVTGTVSGEGDAATLSRYGIDDLNGLEALDTTDTGKVVLSGVKGYFTAAVEPSEGETFSADIVLENYELNGTSHAALKIDDDGYSVDDSSVAGTQDCHSIINGSISGSGDLEFAKKSSDAKYLIQGNVSGWNGTLKATQNTLYLVAGGEATTWNAAIIDKQGANNAGTINLSVDNTGKTTTFSKEVSVSTLTVTENTTLNLDGGTAEAPITHSIGTLSAASGTVSLAENATLTLGNGTNASTHSIGTLSAASGTVSLAKNATLTLAKNATLTLGNDTNASTHSIGTLSGDGSVTLASNATLTMYKASASEQSTTTLGSLALNDHTTLNIDIGNQTFYRIGTATVSGAATIASQNGNGGWEFSIDIDSLTNDKTDSTEDTLSIVSNTQTTNRSIVNINGGDFDGTINLTGSGTADSRKLALNVKDASVLADTVVQMHGNGSQVALAVGVDSITLKGIADQADASGTMKIVSGEQKYGNENDFTSDDTFRTLVIDTDGTDNGAAVNSSTSATLGINLNLKKQGAGSQTFSGDMSAFNGTIDVDCGTLAFTNSSGFTTSEASVTIGAALELGGATSIGTLRAAGTVSLAANATLTLGGGTAEAPITHTIGTLTTGSGSTVTLNSGANLTLTSVSGVSGKIAGEGTLTLNTGDRFNEDKGIPTTLFAATLNELVLTGNGTCLEITSFDQIISFNKIQNLVIENGATFGNRLTDKEIGSAAHTLTLAGAGSGTDASAAALAFGRETTYSDDMTMAHTVHLADDATVWVNANRRGILSGTVNGANHVLTKTGSGELALQGEEINTSLAVNAGILKLSGTTTTSESVVVNGGTLELGSNATLTAGDVQISQQGATLSNVTVQGCSISATATDGTPGSISNANVEIAQLQEDAAFTIEDMTLTNTTVTAATVDTKVNLSNVSATNLALAKGNFVVTNQAAVGTGGSEGCDFSTGSYSGITLANTEEGEGSSIVLNLGDLSCLTPMGPAVYDSITISLEGFTMSDYSTGILFAGDSWLGELLTAQEATLYVASGDVAAPANVGGGADGSTVGVIFSSGSVGTIITITGLNVPEPTTSTLSLLALAALAARRRRK